MSKTYGYLRVSTLDQDNEKFKDAILRYANEKNFGKVDFVDEKISGTKKIAERELGKLLDKVVTGDIIIVNEISRISRSITGIYEFIQMCQEKGVEVHALKQSMVIKTDNDLNTKIMLNTFSLISEIERDFISMRTKEALAVRKANGVVLGRKKGVIGKSKLDAFSEEIYGLRALGLSYAKIGRKYGANAQTVQNWIKKHPAP
jgi:DNA invertase Pin-like site-specific DNA recombinase